MLIENKHIYRAIVKGVLNAMELIGYHAALFE